MSSKSKPEGSKVVCMQIGLNQTQNNKQIKMRVLGKKLVKNGNPS